MHMHVHVGRPARGREVMRRRRRSNRATQARERAMPICRAMPCERTAQHSTAQLLQVLVPYTTSTFSPLHVGAATATELFVLTGHVGSAPTPSSSSAAAAAAAAAACFHSRSGHMANLTYRQARQPARPFALRPPSVTDWCLFSFRQPTAAEIYTLHDCNQPRLRLAWLARRRWRIRCFVHGPSLST
jgi:hypothetical protein